MSLQRLTFPDKVTERIVNAMFKELYDMAYNLTTVNDVEITVPTKGLILRSASGLRWRVTVTNTGVLIMTGL